MTISSCPECGEQATEDNIRKRKLSDLGYHHEDTRYECSNGHTWQVGVPHGQTDDDTFVCPSCGGSMIPHFGHVYWNRKTIGTRPKCTECYYIPDEEIEIELKRTNDKHGRFFVGHHLVTGERGENAEEW